MGAGPWTFVCLAYAGSYGIALVVYRTGGMKSKLAGLFLLAMFVPALAAVITRLVRREGFGDVRWRAFSGKWLLLGLVPPLLATAASCAYLLLSGAGLQPAAWLQPDAAGMITPIERAALGTDPFPASELGWRAFKKLVLTLPLLCLFTFGEEYGWRGYLQIRLAERLGYKRAIVLVAVIWAFWHTGMHAVDTEGIRGLELVATLVLAPAGLCGVGLFFGWMFHRTESLWVLVIAHAMLNKYSGALARFLEVPSERGLSYAQTIAGIALGAVMAWLLYRAPPDPRPARDAQE